MYKSMRLGRLAARTLPLFALLGLGTLSAAATPVGAGTQFSTDDGTYKKVAVSTPEDCSALCKADPKCRGAVTYQPDVTKPDAICRLNDGSGANPVFPQVAPEPLDLNVAVADLNAYRATYGLQPVTLHAKLNEASQIHASDLAVAGIISHEGTDGSTHGDRIHRVGYNFTIAGENVATGQRSWDDVFKAWQDSPGHNENLLRPDVTEFGIALIYEPSTTYSTYWAMLVAAPMDMSILESAELR